MNLDSMIKENNRLVDIREGYAITMEHMRNRDEDFSPEYDALVDKWAEFDDIVTKHQAKLYQMLLEESFKPCPNGWVEKVYKSIKK